MMPKISQATSDVADYKSAWGEGSDSADVVAKMPSSIPATPASSLPTASPVAAPATFGDTDSYVEAWRAPEEVVRDQISAVNGSGAPVSATTISQAAKETPPELQGSADDREYVETWNKGPAPAPAPEQAAAPAPAPNMKFDYSPVGVSIAQSEGDPAGTVRVATVSPIEIQRLQAAGKEVPTQLLSGNDAERVRSAIAEHNANGGA